MCAHESMTIFLDFRFSGVSRMRSFHLDSHVLYLSVPGDRRKPQLEQTARGRGLESGLVASSIRDCPTRLLV